MSPAGDRDRAPSHDLMLYGQETLLTRTDLQDAVDGVERSGAPPDIYREAGGDPGADRLIAFHAAVTAWVRVKVALLRAREPAASPQRRAAASGEAVEFFGLGERRAWQARLPHGLVECGAPASGKSHLAGALSHCRV